MHHYKEEKEREPESGKDEDTKEEEELTPFEEVIKDISRPKFYIPELT